jgi:hypothetical protein
MKQANSSSVRRILCWLALVPLLIGASMALLQYVGWSAVYGGNYGLSSKALLVQEADTKAHLYFLLLMGLATAAALVTASVIPSIHSEDVSPTFRWVIRGALAFLLVSVSICIVAVGLATAGQYFK